MNQHEKIHIALGTVSAVLLVILLLVICRCRRRRWPRNGDVELCRCESATETLITFAGGEKLTARDILEAPGEVVGKSSCGTLYMASLAKRKSEVLLRFMGPACTELLPEITAAVETLGGVRHRNLVPLQAFYSGSKGEKLLLHPYFKGHTLLQFLKGSSVESHKWSIIYRISLGIAKGLRHLHTGLQKPIVHGNLKSKNILLGDNYQPLLSDFGLHLLLNPTKAQELMEALEKQGYKAPELIKMKEASVKSDIYSLGVVFLEMITKKEPIYSSSSTSPLHFSLATSMRKAALSNKVTDMFDYELHRQCHNSFNESLRLYFELAISCCSPTPSLRPDTKHIIKKLEELGRL